MEDPNILRLSLKLCPIGFRHLMAIRDALARPGEKLPSYPATIRAALRAAAFLVMRGEFQRALRTPMPPLSPLDYMPFSELARKG
jgi:hypothetical protein